MQTFIDPDTGQVYAFEDDVLVSEVPEGRAFTAAHGVQLNVPVTLRPYAPPTPAQVDAVSAARVTQLDTLSYAYQSALSANVLYTGAAGNPAYFQADDLSVSRLSRSILAYLSTRQTPDGFYWVAADNSQVPFSYSDLQGLATAINTQSEAAFVKYQDLKIKIKSASTVSDVAAITWGAD